MRNLQLLRIDEVLPIHENIQIQGARAPALCIEIATATALKLFQARQENCRRYCRFNRYNRIDKIALLNAAVWFGLIEGRTSYDVATGQVIKKRYRYFNLAFGFIKIATYTDIGANRRATLVAHVDFAAAPRRLRRRRLRLRPVGFSSWKLCARS